MYYDTEKGNIYLIARYYNPGTGTFITEDPILFQNYYNKFTVIEKVEINNIRQLNNKYVYAINNPIRYCDRTWSNAEEIVMGGMSLGIALSQADTPLPGPGDALGAIVVVGSIIVAAGAVAVDYVDKKVDDGRSKSLNLAISQTLARNKDKNQTIIYRIGSGNATNLTPRKKDIDGLSYTTIQPTKYPFTVTSMEAVNSTGKLVAIQDGTTHVSVRPTDNSEMQEWIDSRDNALTNPHEYTKILQSISIKVSKE